MTAAAARRFLPSDPKDFLRSAVPLGLLALAALAPDARLIIVFQPVACIVGSGVRNREVRAQFDRFMAENPDVIVPFPMIYTLPSDRFSVPAHVKDEWRSENSRRLGKALAEILAREGQRQARVETTATGH